MRRFLDRLYGAAGLLAGLCTIGVLVSVLAAIIARQVGLNIPGTDAYAGYFMAAAGFLALASTSSMANTSASPCCSTRSRRPAIAGSTSSRFASAPSWRRPSPGSA